MFTESLPLLELLCFGTISWGEGRRGPKTKKRERKPKNKLHAKCFDSYEIIFITKVRDEFRFGVGFG